MKVHYYIEDLSAILTAVIQQGVTLHGRCPPIIEPRTLPCSPLSYATPPTYLCHKATTHKKLFNPGFALTRFVSMYPAPPPPPPHPGPN